MAFIQDSCDQGVEGFLSFRTFDLKAEVELCEKNSAYYLLASGTKVPVNKCYLQVRSGARSFIGFGDETAINSVKAEVQSSEVFDLQGRRVAQPTKGLYIMNEKKVMIK